VALGFGREAVDQIDDDEAPEYRRQEHPVPPPARTFEDVRVIGDPEDAVEHQVVDETDQRAKDDRADPGHDSDAQRQQTEDQQSNPTFVARRGGGKVGGGGRGCQFRTLRPANERSAKHRM
jgi:hypothetical protein